MYINQKELIPGDIILIAKHAEIRKLRVVKSGISKGYNDWGGEPVFTSFKCEVLSGARKAKIEYYDLNYRDIYKIDDISS